MEEHTPQRVGVFGGTFDPVHSGHLAVALEVRHRLELDRMLLVVANDPWQKTVFNSVTPARFRFEMVRAAVAAANETIGASVLEASDHEIRRGGRTCTADTLAALDAQTGGTDLFVVVGSDVAASLDTWERPEEVQRLATTVVAERAGSVGGRPPPGWEHVVVEAPALEVSSTDVRNRFRNGRPVLGLLPTPVIDYVRSNGLYGSPR
ncbi:MAG: nicotinate-nucleotide adenylyltransferase [Acidimicrobiaceae bacterium]|nr:nicotinate-nucleotide adenylyltransferase [Acidimicrobiia bacterium]MCY4494592.1 nicotinate-nucleotide adenylyltransferase [Acidimicrobiaceae bacterium]